MRFNSMLRTDYIPLRDTAKLQRLSRYYVDYFGYLKQIVGESDQLVVGRRGTGKTTLLYRALIECIHSWNPQANSRAKARTLAVYILDLSKCQTLSDTSATDFTEFEHVFVSELVDSMMSSCGTGLIWGKTRAYLKEYLIGVNLNVIQILQKR